MPRAAGPLARIPPEDPRLLEGITLLNRGQCFESHEVAASLPRARARLLPWRPSHAGIMLEDVIAQVDAEIAALEHGHARARRPRVRRDS